MFPLRRVCLLLSFVSALQASAQTLSATSPRRAPASTSTADTSTEAPAVANAPGASAQRQQAASARVLRLADVLARAKRNHPLLARARAQAQAAHARADQTRGALFPQLAGQGSVQQSARAATGTQVFVGSSYGVSLVLSHTLWDFGRNYGSWRAAQASARAEEANSELTELETLLTAASVYFEARAQLELLNVAQETLANQQRHLSRIAGFIEVGSRPEIDRAQARTDVANARVQLIQAENGLDVALARLRQAMGDESEEPFVLGEEQVPAVGVEDASMDELLRQAIHKRPEFDALRFQLESVERSRSATRADFLPSLGVRGSVGEFGRELEELGFGWTWSATLTWPIFNGFSTLAELRALRAEEASLTAEQIRQRQQLRADLTEAQLAIRAARATYEALEDAVQNARQRLRLAEGRYETGVGQILELSDAQLQLTSARAQQIQAQYSLSTARLRLEALLGGTPWLDG